MTNKVTKTKTTAVAKEALGYTAASKSPNAVVKVSKGSQKLVVKSSGPAVNNNWQIAARAVLKAGVENMRPNEISILSGIIGCHYPTKKQQDALMLSLRNYAPDIQVLLDEETKG